MWIPFRSRPFLRGLLTAFTVLWLGRWLINESTLADHLVAPLLLDDSPAPADAIVVLGAGVIGDCVPNVNSTRRVVLAARLFREGRAPLMVMSGGAAGGSCPVAEAMARFAAELGVPADRMILEGESRSTHQNGERVAALIRPRRISRLLLVTDRLHMRRASGVFAREGYAIAPASVPIYEGHPDNVSMLAAAIRETAAIGYYRVQNWMTEPSPQPDAVAGAVDGQIPMPAGIDVPAGSGPVVILGASYAGNWRVESIGAVELVNAGVAGQRTHQMLERFDRDVIARRPRAVLIWGFINDLSSADDIDAASAAVKAAYAQMVEKARAAGIQPILATELTMRSRDGWLDSALSMVGGLLGKVSYRDRVNGHVIALNQWLNEFARAHRLLVLDFHGTLSDNNGGRRSEFATEDASHVTDAGYRALTEYARPMLAAYLAAGSQPRS